MWGVIVAFSNRAAAAVRIPLLACVAMTGGVIAFGHVAQRYTSEFLPLLILGAIIGFVDIARRLRPAADSVKRAVVTVDVPAGRLRHRRSRRDRSGQRSSGVAW